jgi:hypothetical protein
MAELPSTSTSTLTPTSESWLVRTVIAGCSPSFCFRRFRRSQQVQHGCPRPVIACICRGLLLQRDVLVAHRAHQSRVRAAIGLAKHIAAHHAPTADRNPDIGRLFRSHRPSNPRLRMRAIIHSNARVGDWWKPRRSRHPSPSALGTSLRVACQLRRQVLAAERRPYLAQHGAQRSWEANRRNESRRDD